jgi:tRNA nucleotidyltransferase (CCA-adding enzyme)
MDRFAIALPTSARRLMTLLEDDGHEAVAVGGCVRDALLGRPVADVDIATSALPTQTMSIAAAADLVAHPTGIAHGTVTVVVDDEPIETTTYRLDGVYRDGRHPETVTFTRDITADLARRDFTINAIAYSPTTDEFTDPFDGRGDLSRGLIRCVGDPDERFGEDALRILRALRFSAQLGFDVEEETAQACKRCAPLLDAIAAERIGDEFLKLVSAPNAAVTIHDFWSIVVTFIPEFAVMDGFAQYNPHHPHDVAAHTLAAFAAASDAAIVTHPGDPVVCMALLLHDIGKPDTFSTDERGGHFYGHADRGAEMAHDILVRLRYPRVFVDEVCRLVKYHGICILPEERSIKRWMNRLGLATFYRLLDVKRGDVSGLCSEDQHVLRQFAEIETMAHRIEEASACFSLKDLAIDGNDIIETLGVTPGPAVGELLNEALETVIDEAAPNERDTLLAYLRRHIAG